MNIITLSHGSGGEATNKLIDEIFYKYFDNDILLQKNDSSVLPKVNGRIAVSTDSFVINPIFFNGGDIGKLSVCGTVNDLAMNGAKPLYITVVFIIEIGFEPLYIVIFGIETVIGMLLCTIIIGIPFAMSSKNKRVNIIFTRTAGLISYVFGVYYMYNLGMNEGLFNLWIK